MGYESGRFMNKGENLRFNGSTLNFLGVCCANVPILFGDFTRHREMMMSTKGFNNKMIFFGGILMIEGNGDIFFNHM